MNLQRADKEERQTGFYKNTHQGCVLQRIRVQNSDQDMDKTSCNSLGILISWVLRYIVACVHNNTYQSTIRFLPREVMKLRILSKNSLNDLHKKLDSHNGDKLPTRLRRRKHKFNEQSNACGLSEFAMTVECGQKGTLSSNFIVIKKIEI